MISGSGILYTRYGIPATQTTTPDYDPGRRSGSHTARAFFSDEYNIEHATLQVEPESHEVCHEITW